MKAPSSKYKNLRSSAKAVSRKGQRGDTVLAHISPEEAMYLEENFGGDINPYTGLPQYGLFGGLGRMFKAPARSIGKILHKPLKTALPLAGSLIGGVLGGPAGSIAGGALGGGLSSGRHPLDRALAGAALGFGHSLFSPGIAKGLGLDPDSFGAKALMYNSKTLGEQLGIGNALGIFGQPLSHSFAEGAAATLPQLSSITPAATQAANAAATSGGLGLGGSSLLDTALLATTIGGFLQKPKTPPFGSAENETMQQAMHRNKPSWGPEHQYRAPNPNSASPKSPPRGYRRSQWNYFPTPEQQEEQMLRVTEEMRDPEYRQRYAKGGQVRYYKGSEGGQSDKRKADLPEKTYIMDATTVSLAGDGNSENGAKRIAKELFNTSINSGFEKQKNPSRNIKAWVSDGEMELSPSTVALAGGGNLDKGIKKLDKFRKNLRKHKGVRKFLPPKSKHLMEYMR